MVGSLLAVGAGQLSAAAIAEKLALGKSQMPGKPIISSVHDPCASISSSLLQEAMLGK